MVDSRLKSKIPRKNNTILKKRGACILKKSRELSVLCDIRVCALIADPNNGKFHTWPENHTQVIELLKQFKNVEKKKKKKSCDVNAIADDNGQTEKRKTMNKMKNLDFSCFDDKLINQLSTDTVTEISKMLNSKIEAARKRVEFLKENMTVSDKGFQHFNASPNFDPNQFNPSPFQSILPTSFSDSYFGQKQLGAIGMGNNWKNFNSEPEFILDSSIRVPVYYFGQEQVGAIGLGNNWNFNSGPNIILDFPPPLSFSPSVDNGCFSMRVPEIMLDYPPPLAYLGVDNGCSTSDCYFGSENAPSGRSTYSESNSQIDEVVGLLRHYPVELEEEEDMFYGGASMATIPPQPLQLLDYGFYY